MKIRNLSAGYGDEMVLSHINGSFDKGRLHIIIGQNGSGKSTLLKACLGLLENMEGTIEIDGENLKDLSPRQRAGKMAHVMQTRIIPDMKVMQLVLHGRFSRIGWPRRYGEPDKEAARQALGQLHISDLAGKSLKELSGGQQQKAYLALALCQDTDWILMDEPSAFLDPASAMELMDTAKKLTEQKKTVIMVLHDLPAALEYGDTITVVNQGRLAFQGSPDELLAGRLLENIFKVEARETCIDGHRRFVLVRKEND
ncbi:MAG: ABC transporter ATP-binding protein [Erysipelotrichaceae bacterium]|nr:ABC transporter ATP-binding protein [Erysipelotrichaceae bacterium]